MSEENKTNKPEVKQDAAAPAAKKTKKKHKSVSFAVININCSFNNTVITIADDRGNTLAWQTAGASGFKGTKKGTPFAAQITASKAMAKVADMGIKDAVILISGPGSGRETAIRAVASSGVRISGIRDVTPIPHNGCRPPKARRV